jgi:hypothetical protein
LYLLSREFGVSRARALLGAAVLGTCPLFFILSVSFMTDAGFVALATWSSFAMVRALRRRSDGWLTMSAIFAMLAAGFRLPAVVLPLAGMVAIIATRDAWALRPRRCAVVLSPLLVVLLLLIWNRHHQFVSVDIAGMENAPIRRVEDLKQHAMRMLPVTFPAAWLWAVAMSGACLLPLVIAGWRATRQQLVSTSIIFAVLLAGYALLRVSRAGVNMPMSPGSTWRLDELGASTDLAPGHGAPHPIGGMLLFGIFCVCLFAGASVLAWVVFRPTRPGEAVLRWTIAGHVALAAVLWLFYDRYILPVLPPLIVLTLLGQPRVRMSIAICGVMLFASLSLIGTRDHLAYNRTLWHTVRELHQAGIAPRDIDAGYVVNGWFQYCIPANAPTDASGKPYVPWLTDNGPLPYVVSSQRQDGYRVVSEHPVDRWLGPDFVLYVLRKE